MRRYAKYKDSGIPWIGQVPEHWKIEPFGRFFKYQKGLNITKADLTASGEKVISYGQIHSKTNSGTGVNDTLFRFVSPVYLSETPQAIAQINDFLFADTSEDLAGCGNCVFIDNNETIFAGYHTLICRPYNYEMPRFLAYLFLSAGWRNQLQANCNGVKVYSISRGKLKKTSILLPPLDEQRAIVEYLDSAVGKIDGYIAEKETEIEKLGLLKQSVIAHAVTKGLNPNAPMKDSGIPWIGQVSETWKAVRLRGRFTERRQKVSDKDYMPLSVAKAGIVPQLDDACKTDNGDNRKLVKAGDFVVNSRSDRKGSCGVSSLDGSVSLINIVLTPHDIESNYVHYLFRSNNYIEEFYRYGRGIVADLWTTRYSEMKNINIPIPPADEQRSIVDFIDGKVREIDGFIAAVREQIEKLKLYKQRLISDVVTGKIKVCREENHE